MYAMQRAWRDIYSPDLDVDEWPAFQALKSVHNTPIEGLWHWFSEDTGVSLKQVLNRGKAEGIFHVGDDYHRSAHQYLLDECIITHTSMYAVSYFTGYGQR